MDNIRMRYTEIRCIEIKSDQRFKSVYQPFDEKVINSFLSHNTWEGICHFVYLIKSDQRFKSTSHTSHQKCHFSHDPMPIIIIIVTIYILISSYSADERVKGLAELTCASDNAFCVPCSKLVTSCSLQLQTSICAYMGFPMHFLFHGL